MATSLEPITIPARTWVNLYAATGITVGVQIIIQNTGGRDAKLSESAAEPTSTTGFNSIPPYRYLTNTASSVGAWAFSTSGTLLQVEEA